MILLNNIFVFFILGLIPVLYFIFPINENFIKNGLPKLYEIMFFNFIPMFVAILMNLIIKFQKNEFFIKLIKKLMVVTNILGLIYILSCYFFAYVGATMFD